MRLLLKNVIGNHRIPVCNMVQKHKLFTYTTGASSNLFLSMRLKLHPSALASVNAVCASLCLQCGYETQSQKTTFRSQNTVFICMCYLLICQKSATLLFTYIFVQYTIKNKRYSTITIYDNMQPGPHYCF